MYFTRNDLLEQYHKSQFEANIPADMFIISAGGALVMHRIRDTTLDLDIDTDQVHYQSLIDAGYPIIDDGFPRVRLNDHTDVHSVQIPRIEVMKIDGVWCYTLEHLVTQYEKLAAHPARKPEKIQRDLDTVAKLKKLILMR
ncbi:hypothetical protein D3C87_1150950 [compost metagenome]